MPTDQPTERASPEPAENQVSRKRPLTGTAERPLACTAKRALAEAAARHAERKGAAGAQTKEANGRGGLEPTRYGDWEVNGLASDF